MKSNGLLFFCMSLTVLFYGCELKSEKESKTSNIEISVKNSIDILRQETLITIESGKIAEFIPGTQLDDLGVYEGEKEIVSQVSGNKLMFMVKSLNPNEEKEFTIKTKTPQDAVTAFTKKTQAEISVKKGGYFENRKYIGGEFENVTFLRVPDEHTDHSFDIRYEGAGWESDLVGYRFYLDWRNATDVFGKKTDQMILQNVGLDGFDSYHEMQPWGMDVLKVGSSLGLGTPGTFLDGKAVRIDKTDSVTCLIEENGLIYSAVKTNYYGWDVANQSLDVESVLSIHAGTRLTHNEMFVTGQLQNICTGIIKDKNAQVFTDQGNSGDWGYLATYGAQSLNEDNLGLAVFFSNDRFMRFTEDEQSHVVELNPESGRVDYYFLAAWEGEKNGIRDESSFLEYIKQTAVELAKPVQITYK